MSVACSRKVAKANSHSELKKRISGAATQNNPGIALRALAERTHDTSDLCDALGAHVNAWQVFSGALPYDASIAAGDAKKDMDAIHTRSPGSASKCLQTYSAELKQMGVTITEQMPPL